MDDKPKFLGEVSIPDKYKGQENKASFCREILTALPADKALLYEFADKQEAKDYRSVLYTMSILKYGEAGHIGTRLVENLLYVWLVVKA